jgi:hypothetical protein
VPWEDSVYYDDPESWSLAVSMLNRCGPTRTPRKAGRDVHKAGTLGPNQDGADFALGGHDVGVSLRRGIGSGMHKQHVIGRITGCDPRRSPAWWAGFGLLIAGSGR